MPDARLLEVFPSPAAEFVIEHISEEFTSLCPKTGHPDFGRVILRYCPSPPPPSGGGLCVELKSLKLYYQSFRDEGIFYEAVTNRIRDDLVAAMKPKWLQVITEWRGRGGIHSRIIASGGGEVPAEWRSG
jgi:7-cyano-7-deazaguanine reductase